MKVELLVREYDQMIGLARYTASLCEALERAGVPFRRVVPHYPWPVRAAHRLLQPLGWDVRTFFTTYPLAAPFSSDALKHLTAQQMAVLLWVNPRYHPCVVTVHDIVPYLVRYDRSQSTYRHPADFLFDYIAVAGLRKADALIAISQYTKRTLIDEAGCSEDKIWVIYRDVNHDIFKPHPVTQKFREQWGISSQYRYVLYVGSENPRKNLLRLIAAFAKVKAKLPNLKLIKVGTPENVACSEKLWQEICRLGLEHDVLFYGHVSDDDLVTFYNLADLFVFPSLYEGFGLPPLEAMACGTPVICSSAASLPEVVGDAAIMVDPYDVEGLAEAMHLVLTDAALREELRSRGLERAKLFTWERAARETIAVYQKVLE